MGEIADDIIAGLYCQECGEVIDMTMPGYPRSCDRCCGGSVEPSTQREEFGRVVLVREITGTCIGTLPSDTAGMGYHDNNEPGGDLIWFIPDGFTAETCFICVKYDNYVLESELGDEG